MGRAEDLVGLLASQGEVVRTVKGAGGDFKPELEKLLALKKEYKDLTGQDPPGTAPKGKSKKKKKKQEKSSEPAQPSTDAAAAGSETPEGQKALDAAAAQGLVVRDLKTSKADKSAIDAAVATLLELKAEYTKITGKPFPAPAKQSSKKDKKKKEAAAPAAAPAAAAPVKAAGEGATERKSKAEKKAEKEAKKAARKAEVAARLEAGKGVATEDTASDLYGALPLINSSSRQGTVYTDIKDLNAELEGQQVVVRGRVHTSRAVGNKQVFVVLRHQHLSVQTIVFAAGSISKQMVKFIAGVSNESIVDVYGTVNPTPEPVHSCSQSDVEISIEKLFVVSASVPRLPLQVEDSGRNVSDKMFPSQPTRLDNRILDLRSKPNQAIFAIQSGVCALFREFLLSQGFREIHSPKTSGAASEGGAEVFTFEYFGKPAFLAQSPQLYKQMAIAADFDRVFEIGPVFRAENSFTHRHMCEFTGVDFEMAIKEHYHEALDVMSNMFVHIFKGLQSQFGDEIALVSEHAGVEPFEFLEPSLVLEWPEAIQMLKEAGEDIGAFDDISTTQEKFLGTLVKKKYHTDFYILDRFPLHIRPFYTMPDPRDNNYSNSYDFMMRGEEIMSGAQRVHDIPLLEERSRACGVDPESIRDYIDAFKYGCPPHAGGGVGMERVVMLFLGVDNIRRTSMFPRDPVRLAP